MIVHIKRKDRNIIKILDFKNKVAIDDKTIYISGTIKEDVTKEDYVIDLIPIDTICRQLPQFLCKLRGEYIVVMTINELFEFVAADISGVGEVYYAINQGELVVADNFFDIAQTIRTLEYDTSGLNYFIKHGYCESGKTTFKRIYRLPPGRMLSLENGEVVVKNYLDQFKGSFIDYNIFKRALDATIRSIIADSPFKNDVVLLSGGIDSSTLLGAIKKLKPDVKALTMNYLKPSLTDNAIDVPRSKYISKKFDVEHEIVDIDFSDVNCSYLEEVIFTMPFAAHLSIHFLKVFELLKDRNSRIWCGQNCDSLYNLGPTGKFPSIPRFLISTPYLKMVRGVKGYKKFQMLKKAIDLAIKAFYKYRLHKIVPQTPKNINELVKYFNESDDYLALSFNISERQSNVIINEMNISDACRMLFDEKLGYYFTGRDHKIIHSAKLFNLDVALPYSIGNMVQLFRNLNRGWADILYPKRFLYRYAKEELNLNRNFFWSAPPVRIQCLDFENWGKRIIATTEFGGYLKEGAKNTQKRMGNTRGEVSNLQDILGRFWVNKIHKELEDRGVDVKWPQSTR